ncbi:MAG: agmatine deiminase family protein, partial [Bacteroidota bacterium]
MPYTMPPEWAPHAATWFSWPHNTETWPGDKLAHCEATLAQAVVALRTGEAVHINVLDAAHEAHVRALVEAAPNPTGLPVRFPLHLHLIPTNDAWCRDHGAIFVTDPANADAPLVATVWGFNAWGGKYPPFDLDDAVADRMAAALGVPTVDGGMVLEGGSIEVNGAGVLITTESCLLNPNRNPGLTRAEIDAKIKAALGVHTILWTDADLAGDDTDAHIDNVARFVSEDTVVALVQPDEADPDHAPLKANADRLRAMRFPDGHPLRVIEITAPAPVVVDGVRLP